jgi:class 3 adenylate cyclase
LGVRAIVCTDIVGSTAIRFRIGDDRADALRRDHDQLMGGFIAAHRGRVLRWTGDGVQCEFNTASAAIAAAIDMQRGVRRYGRSPDTVASFEIRVGVSVGEVTVDHDDAHGVAVIEAVRFEALAAPGEILATDLVERLGQRRSDAVFEEVGERRLKGLDGPVKVLRIVDTHADTPLQNWREVAAGATRTLLVSGQPGVGKSRLVAQLVNRAYAEGATVLAGVCDSDFIVPYQPFAMALREAETDDEVMRAISAGDGPLGPLYATHRRGAVDDLGASDRLELFDAIAALLGRIAADRPLVLVLEDLQWANAPTVQLMRYVLQQLTTTRVLVVATFRGDEIDTVHPLHRLLAEAHGRRSVRTLALAPLSEDNIAEMLAARVPAAPADALHRFARRVFSESAGSPFFVCELLHHLSSTGELAPMVLASQAERLPIPALVRDVVGQRLAGLPGSCGEVLESAAVIGLTFDLDLLAAVTGWSLGDVLQREPECGPAGAHRTSQVTETIRGVGIARAMRGRDRHGMDCTEPVQHGRERDRAKAEAGLNARVTLVSRGSAHDADMKHRNILIVPSFVALISIVAAACGGDDGSSSAAPSPSTTIAPAATEAPAPDPTDPVEADEAAEAGPPMMFPGVLDIGTWATNRFGRSLTFETDVPWVGFETKESFVLTEVAPSGSEELTGEVALLATAGERTVDEVVAELQATEGLTFSEPEPATIVGLDGFVLTAPTLDDDVVVEWLFDTTIEQPWVAFAGTRHEVYVVADEQGTILVWIDAVDATWEPFRTSAQFVLDSINWSPPS